MDQCPLVAASSVTDSRFDCVVIVTDNVDKLTGSLSKLKPVVSDYVEVCVETTVVTNDFPLGRLELTIPV